MRFKVLSRYKACEIMPVSVASDGTLNIANNNVTVAKDSTGVYSVTLNRSSQQLLFPFVMTKADGVARHIAQCAKADITEKTLKVRTFTFADAASDSAFDLFLVMSQGASSPLYRVIPNEVRCWLSNPRCLLFYYDGANDVASLGKYDGTFTKTGTGLYTLTLRYPLNGSYTVVAVTNSVTRHVEYTNKANGSIDFQVVNGSSAAADTELFVMLIGTRLPYAPRNIRDPLRCNMPFTFMNPFESASDGSMVRGSAYMSCVRAGAGDFNFTFQQQYGRAAYGLASSGEAAANMTAVVGRASSGFGIDSEADARLYGLEVGFVRGKMYA